MCLPLTVTLNLDLTAGDFMNDLVTELFRPRSPSYCLKVITVSRRVPDVTTFISGVIIMSLNKISLVESVSAPEMTGKRVTAVEVGH